MKIYWRKPDHKQLEQLIAQCQHDDFTQMNVGSTRHWQGDLFGEKPNAVVENGYLIQRRRSKVGVGIEAYESARTALLKGKCFDLPWVDFHSHNGLQQGETFCLAARAFWLWPTSVCRVIYAIDQDDQQTRSFAIGLGTLPIHAAIGEEKIAVAWRRETDTVDLLIGSYSKPASWISNLLVSYLRRQQNRFAHDSAARIHAIASRTQSVEQ